MTSIGMFKGKRVSDNLWIYGYLADKNYINNINEIDIPCEEVYPDSIGQYTTKNDLNNNPIYVGDIVEQFTIYKSYEQVGNYPHPNIEVTEYEIIRSVSVVTFKYGAFYIGNTPLNLDDFYEVVVDDEDCDEYDDPYKKEFQIMWEDNSYNIRDKYPYLKWTYFKQPHIIGNIFDNPELIE